MDTSKKVRYPLPKTEQEFLFRTRQMKDLLKRTCLNMNENLWSTMVDYDTEFLNPLQGQDGSMDDKLEELKNPTLVYSLMCNFLGRSIVCSRQVFDKYTLTLKKRVKDTMSDVHTEIKSQIENNNTNTTSVSKSVNALDDVLVPILVPYKRANADFAKWSNEPVSWFEYVNEIGLKEAFVSRLRERSVKYDLSESVDFFIDYMAHLHLDNYLYKGLKRGGPSCGFSAERQFKWGFPMNIDIRCVQRKELYGQRRDWIMTKNHEQHKYIRIEYRHVDRDLDPYFHGGHFRAIFSNEINALEYYIKNHMSKQFITEIMHLLYGIEVQKCPGAAIWTMFIVDLIDGDKISQRSIFYAYDARFPKELGLGGVFPGSFHGHTTAARWLNFYYSFILEHWYSYDVTDENEESMLNVIMNPHSDYNKSRNHLVLPGEIMRREMYLLEMWLEYKKERDRKARYLNTIQELYNYVLIKTVEYYEDYKMNFK